MPGITDEQAKAINALLPGNQNVQLGKLIQDALDGNYPTLTIGNESAGDLFSVGSDGFLTLLEESTVWDDKRTALNLSVLGVNSKPDYDFVNRGLLFPQNDDSEYVQVIDEMSHKKKLGTQIRLHVHFIQTEATLPIFKCAYKWWNNGDEIPSSDTIISTANGLSNPIYNFTSNPILQIIHFPFIDPPANEEISSHFEYNLYRDDNLITGDVLGKFIDYHYEIEGIGSHEPFIK